jgi:hypothetical protein
LLLGTTAVSTTGWLVVKSLFFVKFLFADSEGEFIAAVFAVQRNIRESTLGRALTGLIVLYAFTALIFIL